MQINQIDKENDLIQSSIKVALSALGPLGSIIDEFYFSKKEKIRIKRHEEFLALLHIRTKNIEHLISQNHYLKTEEFFDLTNDILKASLNTRHIEKRQMLCELFVQSIINPTNQKYELFLSIIENFTLNHFITFKFLVDNEEELIKVPSYNSLFKTFLSKVDTQNIDIYEFRLYCRAIEYQSLVRFSSNINEIDGDGGYMEPEDSNIPFIIITSLGKKFIELLKNEKPN